MRLRASLVIVLAFVAVSARAQDVRLDVLPSVTFPSAESATLFRTAFGADLVGAAELGASGLLAGGAVGYRFVGSQANAAMSLITLESLAAYRLGLGPAFSVEAGLLAGGYVALYGEESDLNPHVAPVARASFALSPSFELTAGARYDFFLASINEEIGSLFSGIGAFLGLRLSPFSGGGRDPRIEIGPPELRPVFPVLFRYYDDNPLGEVSITNSEGGRIEDVEVSFFVRQYMDAPKLAFSVERLDRNQTVRVPIVALFEDTVLAITEGTSVNAQIQVSYSYRGTRLETSRSQTLEILDRNSIRWDDDRKAAAFVTAKDTTVLRLSRAVAATVREHESVAFNTPVRSAIAMFEALNAHGVSYVVDPQSSYEQLSQSGGAIDYVQFPNQTLEYGSGDCDDLSVLYAALLESVGVSSAFITTPGHIYVAFHTGMDEEEARRTFADPELLIYRDGQAWMPVEITLVERDFRSAWTTGARQWREASDAGVADLIPVREAWSVFEPTGFDGASASVSLPEDRAIERAYDVAIGDIVRREIGPLVERLEDRLRTDPRNPRLRNRLGTVYARYGLLDDARDEFERAVSAEEHGPALVNLGNLEYLDGDPRDALGYYLRAQAVMPDSADVHLSVARAQYELEQYRLAESNFELAAEIDEDLVGDFAYVIQSTNAAGRAASTEARERVLWSDEE